MAALRRAASGAGIHIALLKTKYPQGSEKTSDQSSARPGGPPGGAALGYRGGHEQRGHGGQHGPGGHARHPPDPPGGQRHRRGIVQPKNLLVPMGIAMGELIDFCGGLRKTAARMVAGGPMMGFAFTSPDIPVTKGTSGITILTHEEIRRVDRTVCVRCGRCVDVCPMNLVPTKVAMASRLNQLNLARKYNIMACFECGSCSYICPAGLPLVQLIRTGKALIAAETRK